MKTRKLISEIKGIFVPPKKNYYLGKIKYGTPYFNPMGFNSTIISFRKLIERSQEEKDYICDMRPWIKKYDANKFKNLPIVRRAKDWVFKLFGNYYWLQIGWPIYMGWNELGWKDKYESPRFEWSPAFYIFFFKWQFTIHWSAPDDNSDKYYEMILKYLHYSDKDLNKAREDWGWIDTTTQQSTWNDDYLIKRNGNKI